MKIYRAYNLKTGRLAYVGGAVGFFQEFKSLPDGRYSRKLYSAVFGEWTANYYRVELSHG